MINETFIEKKLHMFCDAWDELEEKIREKRNDPDFDMEADSITVTFDDGKYDLSYYHDERYLLWRNDEGSEDELISSYTLPYKSLRHAIMMQLYANYVNYCMSIIS